MEIKIGDLVSYQGHTVRVMSIINGIIMTAFLYVTFQMKKKVNMVVSGIGEWISMLEKL